MYVCLLVPVRTYVQISSEIPEALPGMSANYQNLLFFQYLTQNDRLGKAPKPVKEARFYVFGKYYVKKITTYDVMLM